MQPYVIAQTHRMASKVMGETRVLNIMLPAGYDEEPGRRYPVIYLLDGGQHEDFTHMAGAVQYASFDWVQRLPPSILVGISNTDRKRDMTFKASPGFVWPKWMHAYTAAYKNAGGSETFMRHIEAEVQPFVERERFHIVMHDGIAALLRLFHQRKAGITVDVDRFQRVHLDRNAQGHEA